MITSPGYHHRRFLLVAFYPILLSLTSISSKSSIASVGILSVVTYPYIKFYENLLISYILFLVSTYHYSLGGKPRSSIVG